MSDLPRNDGDGSERSGKASALDALVAEAKQSLSPRVTDDAWTALENRIVARMAEERSPLVDEAAAPTAAARKRGNVIRIGAMVLAAAAAIVFVVRGNPGGAPLEIEGTATSQAELTAGSLIAASSTEGPGEVRIGGQPAPVGHVLRAGEVVETEGGARAVLERPRKVTWLIERNLPASDAVAARARVKSAGEALILGLESGAIEAQVTPVPSGEAFAVDIAAGTKLVRVAVHGTHLRVSRTGSRVVVDLTEGVVSIGVPPRTGSTYGTLVTAPSHVEFDAADLDGTLRIDHTPAAVRAAVSLAAHEPPATALGARPVETVAAVQPNTPGAAQLAPAAPATVPRPAPVPRPAGERVAPVANAEPEARPGPPAMNLPPREAIAAAVRDCAAARSRPENVRVTVTSSLKLKIAPGGDVETAQFDPPLLPAIQTCAATAIYKAKLGDAAGTTVSIPINFSY